ncbi:TPA_asm: L [Utricularia alphacytorhabdovirus 1]|nr:TPA_asm: L [Utricularia alphacytorhabdovirus 1]
MMFQDYAANDDESARKISSPLPDFHLRNPIQPILWLNDKRRRTARHRHDCSQLLRYCRQDEITIGNHYDLFLSPTEITPNEVIDRDSFDLSSRITVDRLRTEIECFPALHSIDPNIVRGLIHEVPAALWTKMRFWHDVLLCMNAISSDRPLPTGAEFSNGGVWRTVSGKRIVILKTCIAVTSDQKAFKIYDGDWVRMTSDIYTQRFLINMAVRIGRHLNQHQYPPMDKIDQIIRWGDVVLQKFGNDGFKLIKTFEALVVGVLQSKGDSPIVRPDQFLTNTINDITDSNHHFSHYAQALVHIVKDIENPHMITQIYGLHRIWGHPMVISAEGMKRVIKIGRKDIITDMTLSKQAGRMFKLLFCREYRRKHGVYPPIIDSATRLATSILSHDPRATSISDHSLEEWDRIKFRQVYQLPETFNLSMIVADKSISPTKSELVDTIKRRKTVMNPDKRRGVKRWLEEDTLNPREFLESVERGEFPDDQKIIGLTPKERELNPVPRMFSLMSHLLRVYVVLTEQMLSDNILNKFPQITMTDSLLDLTKKMYTTVRSQSKLNSRRGKDRTWATRVVCMSLDFEKWNGHMRKDMTSGVFTPIGDLFGLTELYNVTYDIFEECYYYLADGTYVPNIEDGSLVVEEPLSFTGHKGGMEGLRQKGWTLFTVCGLEVVLSRHNCTYKIMGMGDNQVLQITLYTNLVTEAGVPTEEGDAALKKALDEIFHDLVSMFTAAGLPLKPLETWMSEDLYLYGKVPIWRGVPLSMDLKKLMRMFPFSNAEVMTLENALSTISGNALSATQTMLSVTTAYIMNVFMSALCINDFLDYHPLIGTGLLKATESMDKWTLMLPDRTRRDYELTGSFTLSKEETITSMLMVPRTLMGYNGVNFLELMMRGFPDNLSRDMSYLFSALDADNTPAWLKTVIRNWISPIYMPHINYTTLITDIMSINVVSPRSPSSGIKQAVTNYMTSGVNIRNTEFRDLMTSKYKLHEEFLSELLCDGPELHIRLLHDIMESTIYGYVDSILSKVVKTTTIQRLAMRASHKDIFDQICEDEKTYFVFFKWRSGVRGGEVDWECATQTCKIIREMGWQKRLRGVTIPHPHSFISKARCGARGECDCDDGYMSVTYPDRQLTNREWLLELGTNKPYLGSMTKEKVVVGAGGKVYSAEPLIKRPLSLLRIINWFVPDGSTTSSVIKELVSSVTDLDPSQYVGVIEGAAGAEVHRYKDSSTSHGALTSSSYLLSTRYHVSSDHFSRYCRNSDNTDMHFQALYCYIVETCNISITSLIQHSGIMPRFDHFKQKCYKCISPVEDHFVDLSNDRTITAIPSRKGNPYLFVPKERIKVLEQRSPLSHLAANTFNAEDYSNMSKIARVTWLQDVISDRISSKMCGESVGDDEDDLSHANEVGSFERTMYQKLEPRYIINRVMGNISVIAEWKWLEDKGHHKLLTAVERLRIMSTIIKSAGESSFSGLSMFYCWKESAERLLTSYPEIIPPSSNPISLASANLAMKQSLIGLCYRQMWSYVPRSENIAEDEKDNLFTCKSLIYHKTLSECICLDCKRLINSINNGTMKGVRFSKCKSGHMPFSQTYDLPWKFSHVTIERLRKDCEADMYRRKDRKEDPLPEISNSFVTAILNQSSIVVRPELNEWARDATGVEFPEDWYEPTPQYLAVSLTLPTRTISKYVPLLRSVLRGIEGREVFVLGDGLGTTSKLVSRAGASKVITTTILDPGMAIPHTYVHNNYPSHIGDRCSRNIDSTSSTLLPNDILDDRWASGWRKKTSNADVVISDMEMVGGDRGVDRAIALMKILSLKSWKIVVYKTYLYNCSDLCNLLRVVLGSRASRWNLVTTPFRSAHYPEVWIILNNTSVVERLGLTYVPYKVTSYWMKILSTLTEDTSNMPLMESEEIDIMSFSCGIEKIRMISAMRAWMTIPTVGAFLPDSNRSFSTVYYYMGKIKRPRHVKDMSHDKKLKLYDSDYYRLRDILLCSALAMCSDRAVVCQEMKRTENWYVHWVLKNKRWRCSLSRSNMPEGRRAEIDDYLQMLTSHMLSVGIKFPKLNDTVVFRPRNKNRQKDEAVFFQISQRANSDPSLLYTDVRQI